MDRRIVLFGAVEGYPQRREAEEIMYTVPGAKGVINRLAARL
jgi:osmotically-inducible protein OsmY